LEVFSEFYNVTFAVPKLSSVLKAKNVEILEIFELFRDPLQITRALLGTRVVDLELPEFIGSHQMLENATKEVFIVFFAAAYP